MVKSECLLDTKNAFLQPGFLSSHLNSFLLDLEARGYTKLTMRNYADSNAHFAEWARMQRLTIEDLSIEVLTRFAKHRCRCPGGRKQQSVSRKYVERVRRFVRYLATQEVIASVPSVSATRVNGPLVEEFVQWLRDHRGIGPITVRHYTEQLEKLPSWLIYAQANQINAASVRAWVLKRAGGLSASGTRCMTISLRMYLRFLGSTGRCTAGLEGAIPLTPQWRLSALPRYLPLPSGVTTPRRGASERGSEAGVVAAEGALSIDAARSDMATCSVWPPSVGDCWNPLKDAGNGLEQGRSPAPTFVKSDRCGVFHYVS